MIKQNQTFFNRCSAAIDTVIAFAAVLIAYWLRFLVLPGAYESLPFSFYVYMSIIYATMHLIVYLCSGFYRLIRLNRYYTVLTRIFVNETICVLMGISVLFIFKFSDTSRIVIFISYMLDLLLICSKHMLTRLILRAYRKKGYNLKHVLLIGSGETARGYAQMINKHREYGYHLLGYISPTEDWESMNYLGDLSAIEAVLDEKAPDETIIALQAKNYVYIESVIKACEHAGVHLRIVPCYDKYISSNIDVENLEGTNLIGIRSIPLENAGRAMLKRAMDILVSIIALIITSPILLAAVIGIKLTSPGPIIFKQERIGKDKKPFTMYKLRSMKVNDSSDTAWSQDSDDRKTAFGSLLRKFSIDELPQFWNVLKNDMSVVGPRPEIPFYVDQFKDEVPLYMIKHYVKPGITGWAQVNGLRGDTSIKERVEHDVYYIENWTWWLDLKIMAMTVLRIKNTEQLIAGKNVKA